MTGLLNNLLEINPELIAKFLLPQSPTLVLINGNFAADLSENLTSLHWQLAGTGPEINIQLPKDCHWDQPVVLLHIYTREFHQCQSRPRIIVTAAERSQGSLLEIHHYVGRLDLAEFSIDASTHLTLLPASGLSYLLWQNLHCPALFRQQVWAGQEENSELNTLMISNGAARSHISGEYQLRAPGAQATANGIYHQVEKQQTEFLFKMGHQAPATTSGQLVKGILHHQSQSNFTGIIHIAPGAQKASAGQLAKALLCSPQAQVFARPHLQVEADDVKCAHGMAVAQLNPEELFYLNTRGIPHASAMALLEEAFCQEALLPFVPLPYRQLLTAEMLAKGEN